MQIVLRFFLAAFVYLVRQDILGNSGNDKNCILLLEQQSDSIKHMVKLCLITVPPLDSAFMDG